MKRITEQDKPTDEDTIKLYEQDEVGLGFYTTIDQIIARRLPDGDNDNGKGWQCSKYTAYLATGKREYSTAHPDYGPVNGKDVAAWLVKNYGFKYIDQPVAGAIGSGMFDTKYGHTVMYLYSTGSNTAMVNDANWTPLKVSTHNMDISGWKWVVPGNYNPQPTPTPTPTPTLPLLARYLILSSEERLLVVSFVILVTLVHVSLVTQDWHRELLTKTILSGVVSFIQIPQSLLTLLCSSSITKLR